MQSAFHENCRLKFLTNRLMRQDAGEGHLVGALADTPRTPRDSTLGAASESRNAPECTRLSTCTMLIVKSVKSDLTQSSLSRLSFESPTTHHAAVSPECRERDPSVRGPEPLQLHEEVKMLLPTGVRAAAAAAARPAWARCRGVYAFPRPRGPWHWQALRASVPRVTPRPAFTLLRSNVRHGYLGLPLYRPAPAGGAAIR